MARTTRGFDHHRGGRPLLRETGSLRGVVFVVVNLVAFAVVNAFMYYLATGRWMDVSVLSYRRSLALPLSDMFLRPLSVFSYPWMIVVTGMLVAVVVFVPIMVAVLYRLWVSGLFVLAVVLMGHAPLVAACVAVGCAVAGRTRLRSNLPFLALLSGLAAVTAVYLILRYVLLAGGAERGLPSLRQAVMNLPLILSLLAVVIGGAAVLSLARLTRYRPGVIWPVLLVMAAAPVLVFYGMVGAGELEYALIAGELAPGEALFAAAANLAPPTESPTGSRPATGRTVAAAAGPETAPAPRAPNPQALAAAQEYLDARRRWLLEACDRFLRRHPASPRVPAVMWIQATAVEIAVVGDGGEVRYIYEGPSPEPEVVDAWRRLVEGHPESPQALVAQYRLGIVAVRQGRLSRATDHLRTAQQRLGQFLAAWRRHEAERPWMGAFAPTESLPGLEYYRRELAEVDHVVWLIESNRKGAPDEADERALVEYMKLWPFRDVPPDELDALAAAFANTVMADDFRLARAMAEPEPLARAERLADLAEGVTESAVTANYALGVMAMQMQQDPAWRQAGLKSAAEYLKIVATSPANPYLAQAQKHIGWLAGVRVARTETAPAGPQ